MKRRGVSALLPLLLWTALFIMLPMAIVILLSFVSGDDFGVRHSFAMNDFARLLSFGSGGFASVFTLENYKYLLTGGTLSTIYKSLSMSFVTTLITLLVGYPFSYIMARLNKRSRALVLMLVIIPFWTSALMRMFGLRILLEGNGLLNRALEAAHGLVCSLLSYVGFYKDGIPEFQRLSLLYTRAAVLFGMAYTMLPFMILPIYSSLEKLEASTREAARDLGASPVMAFLTVTLPLSSPGVISGCVLVFVPSTGLFFISKILGGGTENSLGELIRLFFNEGRDWTRGAALSAFVMVLSILSMVIYRKFSSGDEMGVF